MILPIIARVRDIPPIITPTPAIPAIKSPIGGLIWSRIMNPVRAAAE